MWNLQTAEKFIIAQPVNTYTAISLLLDSKQKMFLIKGNDGFMNLKPAAGFLAPCRRT